MLTCELTPISHPQLLTGLAEAGCARGRDVSQGIDDAPAPIQSA